MPARKRAYRLGPENSPRIVKTADGEVLFFVAPAEVLDENSKVVAKDERYAEGHAIASSTIVRVAVETRNSIYIIEGL